MSITNGLREYVSGPAKCGISHICENAILNIADRIDAEHESEMGRAGQLLADAEKDRDYNYANWQECKQKVLQGNITFDELNARIECLEDELSHCIELPKDADGKVWRIGDELLDDGMVCEVVGIGPNRLYYYVDATDTVEWTQADGRRHYHAPTVEDVLDEMLQRFADDGYDDLTGLIAEYSAKLRLAGDDGEQ